MKPLEMLKKDGLRLRNGDADEARFEVESLENEKERPWSYLEVEFLESKALICRSFPYNRRLIWITKSNLQ